MIKKVRVEVERDEFRNMKDQALEILSRIRSTLAVTLYLMGGDAHTLNGEYADFEVWLSDMMNSLDEVICIITDFQLIPERIEHEPNSQPNKEVKLCG